MRTPQKPEAGSVRRRGVLLVAAGAALWGTDTVFRRPLTSHFSSSYIVAAEHLILSPLLLPVLWKYRTEWRALGMREWAAILGISWGGSALATVMFTEAIRTGNPTSAVFLQKTQPLFAALLARLMLHEPLGRRFWSSAAIAIFAAYLVSFGNAPPFRPLLQADWQPAMFASGAAALWGASTVLGRFVLNGLSFACLTALRIVIATPLLVALAAPNAALRRPDGLQLIWLIFLALVPGLAALLVYYRGLGRTRASFAAIAELSFPAVAMVLNWILFDVRITILQAAGFALLWGVIFHLDQSGRERRSSWRTGTSGSHGSITT